MSHALSLPLRAACLAAALGCGAVLWPDRAEALSSEPWIKRSPPGFVRPPEPGSPPGFHRDRGFGFGAPGFRDRDWRHDDRRWPHVFPQNWAWHPVPRHLHHRLPPRAGCEWRLFGYDAFLVERGSGIVVTVVPGFLR